MSTAVDKTLKHEAMIAHRAFLAFDVELKFRYCLFPERVLHVLTLMQLVMEAGDFDVNQLLFKQSTSDPVLG